MISNHTPQNKRHLYPKKREIPHYINDIFDHPLQANFSILSFWGPNDSFARNRCDSFGIELVTAGNAFFTQNNQRYLVQPGEVYLLRKKCRHNYRTGPAGFLHKRCLTFNGPILEPLLYATGLHDCDHIPLSNPSRVAHIFRAIHRLLGRKEPTVMTKISNLTYQLLVDLGNARKPLYPTPIRTALAFMESHIATPLTSEEIARKTGLSQTHFNRLFKQHMNRSPIAYFIEKKMDLAKYLLTQTTMPIKEVASTIGYNDPLYFSAQFKKHTGTSPTRYAQKAPRGANPYKVPDNYCR